MKKLSRKEREKEILFNEYVLEIIRTLKWIFAMTTTTSQHPNARPSSQKRSKLSKFFVSSSKRRRPSIVSSRKTTTVKSFQDDDEIESYQTVANPLQYTATEREAMDRKNSLLWQKLTPAWRVLLLSDGSVTRHLGVLGGKGFLSDDDDDDKDATSSLLSESNVKVEVTSMKPCARQVSTGRCGED